MKRSLLLIVAVGLVVSGSACSKKTPEGGNANTPPVTLPGTVSAHGQTTLTGTSPSVTLEADDDYFEPTFLKASPDANVTVKIENKGEHSHTFTIDALKVDEMLAPGDSKTVTFTLPASLGANFFCKFHRPSGMQGAFYFTEGTSFRPAGTSATPTSSPTDEDTAPPGY